MWHSGSEYSCYRRLICAVINQAILEFHTQGHSSQRLLHKAMAEEWLFLHDHPIPTRMSVAWCAIMLGVPLKAIRKAARAGHYLMNARNEARRERQAGLHHDHDYYELRELNAK